MRSRTEELHQNSGAKENELEKNRERGKIRWRSMIFAQKKVDSKREGQKRRW